jgi:hypothetical protein
VVPSKPWLAQVTHLGVSAGLAQIGASACLLLPSAPITDVSEILFEAMLDQMCHLWGLQHPTALGLLDQQKRMGDSTANMSILQHGDFHSDSARFGQLELVQLSPRGCPSVKPLPNRVTSLQLDHPLFGSLFIPVFGIYYSDICYLDCTFEWLKNVRYVYIYSYILPMFGQFNPTCRTWNSHALLVDVVFCVIISN